MKNPWEEIPLTDYENHMKLDSVMQLKAMNEMMKGQFDTYPISSVVIFGIAGGNGLEHNLECMEQNENRQQNRQQGRTKRREEEI